MSDINIEKFTLEILAKITYGKSINENDMEELF